MEALLEWDDLCDGGFDVLVNGGQAFQWCCNDNEALTQRLDNSASPSLRCHGSLFGWAEEEMSSSDVLDNSTDMELQCHHSEMSINSLTHCTVGGAKYFAHKSKSDSNLQKQYNNAPSKESWTIGDSLLPSTITSSTSLGNMNHETFRVNKHLDTKMFYRICFFPEETNDMLKLFTNKDEYILTHILTNEAKKQQWYSNENDYLPSEECSNDNDSCYYSVESNEVASSNDSFQTAQTSINLISTSMTNVGYSFKEPPCGNVQAIVDWFEKNNEIANRKQTLKLLLNKRLSKGENQLLPNQRDSKKFIVEKWLEDQACQELSASRYQVYDSKTGM